MLEFGRIDKTSLVNHGLPHVSTIDYFNRQMWHGSFDLEQRGFHRIQWDSPGDMAFTLSRIQVPKALVSGHTCRLTITFIHLAIDQEIGGILRANDHLNVLYLVVQESELFQDDPENCTSVAAAQGISPAYAV